jgi:hypothetical protein
MFTAVGKKIAQNKIFRLTVFLPLDKNYEIHFSRDISSLAILHVDHTQNCDLFSFRYIYMFNHDII